MDIRSPGPASQHVPSADPFARSTQALQATIDVLGNFQDLDQVVPRVLEIVGQTFAATSCGLYENDPSGIARLLYWYVDGRTLLPTVLAELDPEKYGLVRRLAEGFKVPDSYLGRPAAQAIGPVVLDHVLGTSVPEFDEFAVGAGWDFELNIGVGAGGVRASTFNVCRSRDNPFTPDEVELAESLATQLGLALRFARLSKEANQVAIAKEQTAAAERHAAELERADSLLRAVVDASRSLVENPDLEGGLSSAVTALGKQTGVDRVYVFRRIESAAAWALTSAWRLPGLEPHAEIGEELRDSDFPEMAGMLLAGQAWYPVHGKQTTGGTGRRSDLVVPVLVAGGVWGCVGFGDHKAGRDWSDAEIRVLEGAASAISAAVSRRDSEANLRDAVAREREEAAKEQTAIAEQTNRAIQRSIDALTTARDTRSAILELLRTLSNVLSPFGLFDIGLVELSGAHRTLRVSILLRDGEPQNLVGTALDRDFPVDEPPLSTPWARIQAEDFVWGLTSDPTVLLPEVRDYHELAGTRSVAYVPMRRGAKTIGWIALSFASELPLTTQQIEFVRTLAGQVSLAVELERVAAVDRERAIAIEREASLERRVADLASVNSVLTSSLARLSEASNMREFLAHVFAEILRITGATNACATRYKRETNQLQLELFHNGRAPRWGLSDHEISIWAAPYDADITPAFRLGLQHRQIFIASMMQAQTEVPIEAFALPGGLEWMAKIGGSDAAVSILFAGDQPVGTLHLHFTAGRTLRPADLPLLNSLSQQAAIALRLVTLADEAQQSALAREREAAAEDRAKAFARSNKALQATTEALGDAVDLDQIVPRVLAIVAETFGSIACALFENAPSGRTRLHYWNVEGRTYTPAELLQLDPEKFGLVRTLAEGFEVPDSYLGIPPTAVGAVVLDHILGTSVPEFDAFALGAGWETELNVGVGAGGIRSSTLVIYRQRSRPFAPDQIALAESLATQLGLAVEFARLAEEAKQAAIARELEQAAAIREAEARRISDFLSVTLGKMSEGADLRQTVESILTSFAREIGAQHVLFFRHDAAIRSIRLELSCIEGRIRRGLSGEELPLFASPFPDDITPAWRMMVEMRGVFTPSILPIPMEDFAWPGYSDYAKRFALSDAGHIVLFAGDVAVGSIGFALTDGRTLKPSDKPFIEGVAKQAALAIRMADLAEEARQVALTQEREEIARLRAAELSKANDAMRQAIESLAIEPDLIPFAGRLLKIIGQQFGAPVVEYWTNASANVAQLKLTCRDGQVYAGSDMENDPRVSGIAIPAGITGAPDLHIPRTHFVVDDLPNDPIQKAVFAPLGLDLESWCNSRNVGKHLNVPLRSGEITFGALVIYISAEQHFSDVIIELAYALAHQLTLAIRLTDLALESQRATIAREREKAALEKAEALARANDALRLGAERITSVSGDSNAILDVFLLESVRAVQASSGAIVRRLDGPGTECVIQSLAENGELIRPQGIHTKAEGVSDVMRRIVERGTFFLQVEEIRDWFPEAYEHHVRCGNRIIGHFPLKTNDRVIGYLGLTFREDKPDPMVLETVTALAVQASMAMEMKRLADESRAAAIALEQDKATREQAAQLARSNEALKLSLATMSTGTSGRALLEGMLTVLRDSMNALSVALRIRDPRVLDTIADDRYALEACVAFPGFAARMSTRQPLFLPVSEDETLPNDKRAELIGQGVRSQLAIPMLLGEELVGALMIRLSSDQRPANEQWEVARALGHQATLAIRLTQLASEARQEARAKAASDERAAIARELHDTLLQSFTGVMLQLRALGLRALPDDAARAAVSAIESQAAEAVQEARRAVGVMRGRPEVDLPSDLRRFVESIRATTGLAAELIEEGISWAVPPSAAGGMLRVAQEALRNAARHSGGNRVRIGLSYEAGSVQVSVADNGSGFELAQAQARPGHFGISGMRERAQEIGAVLEIHSVPGEGTSVRIRYISGAASGSEKSAPKKIL